MRVSRVGLRGKHAALQTSAKSVNMTANATGTEGVALPDTPKGGYNDVGQWLHSAIAGVPSASWTLAVHLCTWCFCRLKKASVPSCFITACHSRDKTAGLKYSINDWPGVPRSGSKSHKSTASSISPIGLRRLYVASGRSLKECRIGSYPPPRILTFRQQLF